MKKWSQAATFNHNGEFIPTHRRGPDIDLFRGEGIFLICRKYFCLKLSSNLVKIIAHQFPGQKNCLQILNSCHYSPCQLEGQQKAPSKNGQSQEQPFTSHYSYSSSWESEDERKLCNQLATLCFFLFGWMQVVVWERWPVSLIGWGARCVSQELQLPLKTQLTEYGSAFLRYEATNKIYMEVLASKQINGRLDPPVSDKKCMKQKIITSF